MSRRLHVAGSAHPSTARPKFLRFAHEVVRHAVDDHLTDGGSLLCQLGDDPRHDSADDLRCLFDWTVMETCLHALDAGNANADFDGCPLVHAVCSTTGRAKVSPKNERTLSALRDAGALQISTLPELWRSGALIRQVQARFGEVLVTIGGSVGVEHLAELYAQDKKPIIPLDLDIGSFYGDGRRGGNSLVSQARTQPGAFFEVSQLPSAAAHLDGLRATPIRLSAKEMADRLGLLLKSLRSKQAFYVRLLDRKSLDFEDVDWFFRNVVDHVVAKRSFERLEVGTDPSREAFIDADIFVNLHYADAAIVDMTGQRLNCAIELGYALARSYPVILSVRDGDCSPPFDVDKLPFFFWDRSQDMTALRAGLDAHWSRHAARPPVVSTRSLFGLLD